MRYLWAALIAVTIAAALWGQAAANEGCPASDHLGWRVGVTLALVVIGAVAWLPLTIVLRSLVTGGDRPERPVELILSALWLLGWTYVWWQTWYINFGCVD